MKYQEFKRKVSYSFFDVFYIVHPENCDVAECTFCATFAFAPGVQLLRNFASFWAVSAQIIFTLGKFWGKLEPLSTHNHSFPKFVAVQKLQLIASLLFSLLMPLG